MVPGLLQTPEYARALFSRAITVHKVPNDVNDAVAKRMQRQEMLYRTDKAFHFVITDSTLRNRGVPQERSQPESHSGQPLDLVELAAVPVVDGVIGEPMSWLVKPETPIKHFATAFTA